MINSAIEWVQRNIFGPRYITSADAREWPVQTGTAGVEVNATSAKGLPAFYRGVDFISSTVARIGANVYERLPSGRRRATEHPAWKLLKKQANPLQTAFSFKQQLVADSIWNGNGYAWIERIDGKPVNMWLLDPEQTHPTVAQIGTRTDLFYTTYVDGKPIILRSDEVIHVKGTIPHSHGLMGHKLIDLVRESLGLGIAVIRYGAKWFENCGHIGTIVVETPEGFEKDKETMAVFKAAIESGAGVNNSNKVMLLTYGAKLNRNPVSNDEAQFLQSMEQTAIFCATFFGLPAFLFGARINSSYGSIDAELQAMLSHKFDGVFCNIEQELSAKLLSEAEKEDDSHYIEFNRTELTEADPAAQHKIMLEKLNGGGISEKEYREFYNLPTEKKYADGWRLPNNITLLTGPPQPPAPVTLPPPITTPEQEQNGNPV